MKDLKELLEKTEQLDWSFKIYNETNPTRNYVDMQKYSPAGEDFGFVVDFNEENSIESFIEDLEAYYENFDPDEHVEMWVDSRGKNGVPGSIRELIDDADEIKDMIEELLNFLKENK